MGMWAKRASADVHDAHKPRGYDSRKLFAYD